MNLRMVPYNTKENFGIPSFFNLRVSDLIENENIKYEVNDNERMNDT